MPTHGPWTPILVPALAFGLAAAASGESLTDLVSKPVDQTRASSLQGKSFFDKDGSLSLGKSALSSRAVNAPPAFTTQSAAMGGKSGLAGRAAPMGGTSASMGASESPFSGKQALGFTDRTAGFQEPFPTQAAPGFDSAGSAHGFGAEVPVKPYTGPTPKAVKNAFAEQAERNLSIGELKEILNRETGDGPGSAEKASSAKTPKAPTPTASRSDPSRKSARGAVPPEPRAAHAQVSELKAEATVEPASAP